MKKERLILVALIAITIGLSAVFAIRSHAQSPTPIEQQVAPPVQPAPQVPTDPQTAVDIQGNRRYLVGPGDVLDVRVFGQSDLNSTVEIDDEGNISSLPFLETPIPAMCHNEKEIQKALSLAYSKYLKNPKVSVRVMERKSRPPAAVFGAVRVPTRVQMMRRVRLHELLVAAGGVTLSASGKIQIIHTEKNLCPQDAVPTPEIADVLSDQTLATSTLDKTSSNGATLDPLVATSSDKPNGRVSSFAGTSANGSNNGQTTQPPGTVATDKRADSAAQAANTGAAPPEKPVTQSGNDGDKTESDIGKIEIYEIDTVRNGVGRDDPYIRPGDIVIVTEGEPIYLTGYLNAPTQIVMKDNMTLVRAIAMAGGIQKTAKHDIFIYRQVKGKVGPERIKVDYDAIRNGKQPDFVLQAYDIIDVRPQSSFSAENMREILLGIGRGTITNGLGSLPYRVIP